MVQCQYRIETSPAPLSWDQVVGQKLVFVENGQQRGAFRGLLETFVQVTINHYNRPTRRHFYSRPASSAGQAEQGGEGRGARDTVQRRQRATRETVRQRTTGATLYPLCRIPSWIPSLFESVNEFGNQQVSISIGPRDFTPPFTPLFPFPFILRASTNNSALTTATLIYVDFVKSCDT